MEAQPLILSQSQRSRADYTWHVVEIPQSHPQGQSGTWQNLFFTTVRLSAVHTELADGSLTVYGNKILSFASSAKV